MSITLVYQELQDYDVPARAQIMIPLLDKNLTSEIQNLLNKTEIYRDNLNFPMFTSRFEQCEIRLKTDLIMPTVVITLDAFDLDVILRILIGYLHDHKMQETIQGIFVSDYIAGKSFVDGALQRCEDEKIEVNLVNLPYREKRH
jgi:hypothetical protein